jgi:hypothetical protein
MTSRSFSRNSDAFLPPYARSKCLWASAHPLWSPLKARVASPGEAQHFAASVGGIWLNHDQAVAFEGTDIAAKRCTIHDKFASSAASVLIVIAPRRLSFARIPYCVVRNPAATRYRS